MPVAFAREPRLADTRARDIARVFTAIETIDGADGFETFLQNIAARLRRDDVDEDQIDAIVATIRTQRQLPGSQLGQFLDFLDDEALSRVRLQVSMRIMQAIAEHGGSMLKEYVGRVRAAYEAFAGANGEALLLDGSADYGVNGRTDLAEQLRKAMFYSCLPVWAEWAAQLYESRMNPGGGFKTVREVSYRFRVNGLSPHDGQMKRSFDKRLDRMQEVFDAATEEKSIPRLPRDLAQLVFLYLVTPRSTDGRVADVRVVAGQIAEDLRRRFEGDHRHPVSGAAPSVHRDAGRGEGSHHDSAEPSPNGYWRRPPRDVDSFTVSVRKGVVNWDAVISMSAPGTDILVGPKRGDPKTAWFEHLTIAEAPAVPGSIVSYNVETR